MRGDSRPNIVMIVADDLGYADLGCYGQFDFATPALDRAAREGTRFTHGYANSALCTNTRVALITGRWQYRFAIGLAEPLRYADRDRPDMRLPADHPTLPGMLRAAGYTTALIGKWHLGALPANGPLRSGYESFYGISGGHAGYFSHLGEGGQRDLWEDEILVEEQGYLTDLLSDRAVAYVKAQSQQERPFFLSLHYTAPHWPWSSPSVEAAARERESRITARHLSQDGGSPAIYGEMVSTMDAGIGRLMQALAAEGVDEDTLVIFTSDNGGERFSNMWPFVGRKRDLLEGGLRVPLIFRWPGRIAAGRTSTQVAITMDLTATCLAAAGVSALDDFPLDGVSLLQHLCDGAPETARTLYWRMHDPAQRASRSAQWKYLKIDGREFLFDLSYDWRERTNFAEAEPQRLEAMREDWERWSATMLPLPGEVTSERLIDLAAMRW